MLLRNLRRQRGRIHTEELLRRFDGRDIMEEFLRWAAKSGVSDAPSSSASRRVSSSCLGQSLVLSYFPDAGGRGLAAARDLAKGERVLAVPKSALLSSDSVLKSDERLATSVKRKPNLSTVQILTVCLLAEVGRGKRSRWYLYLAQLPRSYDTLSYFTPPEIKALQVDDAVSTCEKIAARVEKEWKEALALMQEIGLHPRLTAFKAWLWASATVSTRALHVPWDEAGCLCPVGDFFNYDAPDDDKLEDDIVSRLTDAGYEGLESAYCFYARRSYKKGEQVLLCYGTYTNLELLENYGFLINSNTSDKVPVPSDLGMNASSSWPRDAIYIQGDGKPSFALLATLRLWGTPHHLRRKIGRQAYSGLQISLESEVSAMKWLEKTCHRALRELPTNHIEDSLTLEMVGQLLECSSEDKYIDLLKTCEGHTLQEICKVLQATGLEGHSLHQGSVQKVLWRLRLALQWRLWYKSALLRCISYCRLSIDEISSQKS